MKNLEALRAADLRRLAREAEGLAMECVEGTAPRFAIGTLDGCAAGCVIGRAGLQDYDVWLPRVHDGYMASLRLVGMGNDTAPEEDRTAAVVFPLLAVSDAFRTAARSALSPKKSRTRRSPEQT